jgi:hypothetical protein
MSVTGILQNAYPVDNGDLTYTVTDADFFTAADPNGDAFYNLTADTMLVFAQAVGAFDFMPVTGVMVRYRVVEFTPDYNNLKLSLVLRVDDDAVEFESFKPDSSSGVMGVGFKTGPRQVALLPSELLYPVLPIAFHAGCLNLELEKIANFALGGGGGGVPPVLVKYTGGNVTAGTACAFSLPQGYVAQAVLVNGVEYSANNGVSFANQSFTLAFDVDVSTSTVEVRCVGA